MKSMQPQNTLTAVSPIDGRYASKTASLRPILSEYGLIYFRVKTELEWFKFLASHPDIEELPSLNSDDIDFINQLINEFDESDAQAIKDTEATTNHDVKAVEYWIKDQLGERASLKPHLEFVHFACTSEDINNLSHSCMLNAARSQVLIPSITKITDNLKSLAKETGDISMLSRTHGQTASPTTMGKEIANVCYRLDQALADLTSTPLLGKMNGAVGNYNAHLVAYPKVAWQKASKSFVESLGLTFNPYTTQIEPHDCIARFCLSLKLVNQILLDLDRDIWTYISLGYFKQKLVENEIGSSTMPHKVNPIDFENSEGNLGLANAILNHLSEKLPISRLQRDLSDSTVLRNLGVGIGYSLIAFQATLKGLSKLEINPKRIQQDLDDAWEVLAEPIQMVMRRAGVPNSYEALKAFTRGKDINKESIRAFIDSLDLSETDKKVLSELSPSTYIGLAKELAEGI